MADKKKLAKYRKKLAAIEYPWQMVEVSQNDREKARQEAIDAVPFEPGQWAWGTRAVAWPDDRNGTRVLLEWTGRTWHGVEVSNAWAPTQIIDVIPVDRPADPGGAPVTENAEEALTDPKVRQIEPGIIMRPFHIPVPGLGQEFHVYCETHPDFGFCGDEDHARVAGLEHGRHHHPAAVPGETGKA